MNRRERRRAQKNMSKDEYIAKLEQDNRQLMQEKLELMKINEQLDKVRQQQAILIKEAKRNRSITLATVEGLPPGTLGLSADTIDNIRREAVDITLKDCEHWYMKKVMPYVDIVHDLFAHIAALGHLMPFVPQSRLKEAISGRGDMLVKIIHHCKVRSNALNLDGSHDDTTHEWLGVFAVLATALTAYENATTDADRQAAYDDIISSLDVVSGDAYQELRSIADSIHKGRNGDKMIDRVIEKARPYYCEQGMTFPRTLDAMQAYYHQIEQT
ncbi:MAG: hypothetical protein AAFQ52_15140, partial [Chloroflexota bacterium]